GAPAEGCVPLDCIPRLIRCAPGRSLLRRSSAVPPNFGERQRKVACHSTAFLDSSRALLGAVCCREVRLFGRTRGSASGRLRATRLHSSTLHARSWAQAVAEKSARSSDVRGAPAEGCVPLDCIPRLIKRAPGRSLLRRSSAVPPNFGERQRKVAC